jgi:hypothetical protein
MNGGGSSCEAMRLTPLPALGRCDRGGPDQQASQRGVVAKASMTDGGETVQQKTLVHPWCI